MRPTSRFPAAPAAALLAVLLFALAAPAAVYDPALTWETIVVEHFRIHHPRELAEPARRLAQIAERVHGPMTEAAGWVPADRTEVTLVDSTDLANGNTSVLPYDRIVLFAVEPAWAQSIADYGEWLEVLFIHEYAHVLGIAPRRGYAKVFEAVFGRVDTPFTPYATLLWFLAAPPNVFLPPWLKEGFAVNYESDFTGRGRKNATYYDMIYRADVAADRVPTLDRLGGDFPGWPSASTPYIYGARLLALVEREHGRETLGKLMLGHAGRFPYAIERPAAALTGEDYPGLYRRMREELYAEYTPRVEALRAAGLTPVTEVAPAAFALGSPLWLDEGRIAYTHRDTTGPAELRVRTLDGGGERAAALRPGGDTRPTRDGEGRLVFTRTEYDRPLAGGLLRLDLYAVDPEGGFARRLTHGARLRYADYSPAAGAYVGVRLEGLSQRLVRFTLADGELREETLLAEPGTRYDAPRWSPGGQRVAFSRKAPGGTERLAVLDIATGAVRLLTAEGSRAGFPAWSPDGGRIAFTWDRGGVFDLYECDPDGAGGRRLTRLVGGGFEPDWSPGGTRIAFSHYSHEGFAVALLSLDDALGEPAELGSDETLPAPAAREAGATPEPGAAPLEGVASEPYSPWRRLVPAFWFPDLTWDNGGVAPGVWTSAQDPLEQHKYYVAAFWSAGLHRPYFMANYVNDVWRPTLSVEGMKLPISHDELLPYGNRRYDYSEEARGAGVEVRMGLPRVLREMSLAVGWRWEEVARLSRIGDDLDGHAELADLPFEGRQNPLTISTRYDSSFPYDSTFTLGPEGGRRIEALFRWRHEATGSERASREWVGDWREYLSVPGLPRHVLALRGKGGIGDGEETLQSLFQLGGVDTEFPLRGYPGRADRGTRVLTTSAEARFPLWSPYRGAGDWPAVLGRLHGALFYDMGRIRGGADLEGWRRAAGAEVRVDTVLGYYFATTFAVGYAHGFDEDGAGYGYMAWEAMF